ncbi:MAG: ABC transporter substrate-binding protein [Desulfatibacillum sp.]|nr:ABC transporter substrate-binding protein [Desulfatibacillum sp.]
MRLLCMLSCLLVLTALPFLSSCEKEPDHPKTVRIGVLFPLSGDLGEAGTNNVNAVILAVDEITALGGIQSLGGARLELVLADTQGQSRIADQEAERLIRNEGVSAIIEVYQSSVANTVTEVTERLGVPILISSGMADVVTEKGLHYTFRVMAKAEHYGRDMVEFLAGLSQIVGHPIKRLALLHENTAFGTSAALAQKKALHRAGLEVVVEVSYRAAEVTDLNREVSRVLDAGPDAIFTATYVQDSILMARAFEKAGMDIPLVNTGSTMISPLFIQELGPAIEKYFALTDYSKYLPAAARVNESYQKRFGLEMPGDCALAYQCVWIIKEALEKAASTDKNAIRDALAATDMPAGEHMILAVPSLSFDQEGQNKYSRAFVIQVQNGEIAPVWPPEYAHGKISWKGTCYAFDAEGKLQE